MSGSAECIAQRADNQSAHQCRIAEPHLGLGGMDIDVDFVRRPVEKQRDNRVAVADEHVTVCRLA